MATKYRVKQKQLFGEQTFSLAFDELHVSCNGWNTPTAFIQFRPDL